jgi:hypothetical protein
MSQDTAVVVAFDYAALAEDKRKEVEEATTFIQAALRATTDNVIEIGRRLQRVKADLAHGQWQRWLKAEFQWTERSAQYFMNTAVRFGSEAENFSAMPASVVYMLAAPSTPGTVIEAVREGSIPAKVKAVRQAIKEAKTTGRKRPAKEEVPAPEEARFSSIPRDARLDMRLSEDGKLEALTLTWQKQIYNLLEGDNVGLGVMRQWLEARLAGKTIVKVISR